MASPTQHPCTELGLRQPLDLGLFHYFLYSSGSSSSDFVTTKAMSLHIPLWKAFMPSFSSISWVFPPRIRSKELTTQMMEHLLMFCKGEEGKKGHK